jgi:hypothetical protein
LCVVVVVVAGVRRSVLWLLSEGMLIELGVYWMGVFDLLLAGTARGRRGIGRIGWIDGGRSPRVVQMPKSEGCGEIFNSDSAI